MEIGQAGTLDHAAGGIMRRLVLGRKPGDQVGPEHDIRAAMPRLVAEPHEIARQMPALHPLQDGIVAVLRGQVKMRHQPVFARQHIHEARVGLRRIDRRQPQAAQARKLGKKHGNQITKPRAPGQIASPGGDIDPGQHNLGNAAIDEACRRIDDLTRTGGPVVAAAIGNDAEGAAVVASLLYLKKAACVPGKGVQHMGRGFAYLHHVADNHRRVALGKRLPGRRGQLVVIADHMVDLGHGIPIVGGDLRGASGNDDPGIGILAARAANSLAGLALGLGRHSAGIEDDRVVQAGAGGLITNNLGFPDIQPAAECLDTRRVTA